VAGEPQEDVLGSVPAFEVSSGLFGATAKETAVDVPQEYMKDVEMAEVSFDVVNTNAYGELIVEWNGKEIMKGKAPSRHYNIEIQPDLVKSSNALRVYCNGPGWYFWASTVYEIKDFRASVVHGKAKTVPFRIASEELQSFDRGELSFLVSDKSGKNFTVSVNGRKIYNRYPETYVRVNFTYSDVQLKTGTNLITFMGEGGSFRVQEAKLEIYLLSARLVKSRTFYLSKEQYDFLSAGRKGFIELDVSEASSSGSMKITLNGKELTPGRIQAGLNRVEFTAAEAAEGSNELEFSGDGAWNIPAGRVYLEG
jgi:hypothetical protein